MPVKVDAIRLETAPDTSSVTYELDRGREEAQQVGPLAVT